MSTKTEYTHPIRLGESDDLETLMKRPRGGRDEDYDGKLEAAQRELERIQQEREMIERKKREQEELNMRRNSFVTNQSELSEKLGAAMQKIDRSLFEIRQEGQDLEDCRTCFAGHLDKLQRINPDQWTPANIAEKLDRAAVILDAANDDFDSAAAHFSNSRSGAIFGQPSKRTRAKRGLPSEFAVNLQNGFAFNLPVIVLGSIALLIYLMK